jgi:hypothetical protein
MKKRIAMLVSTLALVALAGAAQAATTMFAVQNSSAVDQTVIQDNGYVGIGTNAPGSAFHVTGADARAAQIYLQQNTPTALAIGATGAGILLHYNLNGGLPPAGTRLGYILFGGLDGATQRNPAGIVGYAEGTWATGATPAAGAGFYFATTPVGTVTRTERLRITGAGFIGIGTSTPTSVLSVVGLPAYADNASAITGGLTVGAFYRNGDIVQVVH